MVGFDGLQKRSPDTYVRDEEERKLKEELLEVFGDPVEVAEGRLTTRPYRRRSH